MIYVIDYRNGSMGSTLLAHALFSCGQLNIDLDKFFGDTGHAHAVGRATIRPLMAKHAYEDGLEEDQSVILEVKTSGFYTLLTRKMSYNKWIGFEPTIDNLDHFFKYEPQYDIEHLWKIFYNDWKPKDWPPADTYEARWQLPEAYRLDAEKHFMNGVSALATKLSDLTPLQKFQFLVTVWFGKFNVTNSQNFSGSKLYNLQDYLIGDYRLLKEVVTTHLGWDWDDDKSNAFYQASMQANKVYTDWLKKMMHYYEEYVRRDILPNDLLFWEQAALLGYMYHHLHGRVDNFLIKQYIENQGNITWLNHSM